MSDREAVRIEEARDCLICGARGVPFLADLEDAEYGTPERWSMSRCTRCGWIWLSPRPHPGDIAKLYGAYYTHSEPQASRPSAWQRIWGGALERGIIATTFGYRKHAKTSGEKAMGRFVSWFRPARDAVGSLIMWIDAERKGRLLDVGCGAGGFLLRMRDLGWEVTGVEPDVEATIGIRTGSGLNVLSSSFENSELLEDHFDIITMNHTLEHMADPVRALEKAFSLLKKGGTLVLVTPNVRSLGFSLFKRSWKGLDIPRHYFIFAPRALGACAHRANFRAIRCRTLASSSQGMFVASLLLRFPRWRSRLRKPVTRFLLRGASFSFYALENLAVRFIAVGEEILTFSRKPN